MKVIDILPKIVQWESIPYASDFKCQECGESSVLYKESTLERPNLIGWCETYNGFMAVMECPVCHSKYRFHPHMTWFDLEEFDFYLGAYYIGDGEPKKIANAKDLNEKLTKK